MCDVEQALGGRDTRRDDHCLLGHQPQLHLLQHRCHCRLLEELAIPDGLKVPVCALEPVPDALSEWWLQPPVVELDATRLGLAWDVQLEFLELLLEAAAVGQDVARVLGGVPIDLAHEADAALVGALPDDSYGLLEDLVLGGFGDLGDFGDLLRSFWRTSFLSRPARLSLPPAAFERAQRRLDFLAKV